MASPSSLPQSSSAARHGSIFTNGVNSELNVLHPLPTEITTSSSSSSSSNSSKNRGEILMNPKSAQAIDGVLDITLHHARDIHNICIYGNQDVYAKFSITQTQDAVYSTQPVRGGGKNPNFNQSLQIFVSRPDAVLKCELWMMSCAKNYLEDQLLGFVLVPLCDFFGKGRLTKDFLLTSTELFHTPAGTVCLSLLFCQRGSEQAISMAMSMNHQMSEAHLHGYGGVSSCNNNMLHGHGAFSTVSDVHGEASMEHDHGVAREKPHGNGYLHHHQQNEHDHHHQTIEHMKNVEFPDPHFDANYLNMASGTDGDMTMVEDNEDNEYCNKGKEFGHQNPQHPCPEQNFVVVETSDSEMTMNIHHNDDFTTNINHHEDHKFHTSNGILSSPSIEGNTDVVVSESTSPEAVSASASPGTVSHSTTTALSASPGTFSTATTRITGEEISVHEPKHGVSVDVSPIVGNGNGNGHGHGHATPSPRSVSSSGVVSEDKAHSTSEGQDSHSSFTTPLVSINLEPQEPMVQQQDIVDMYMKSMQQFTESLAKMKLPSPLDLEGGQNHGESKKSESPFDVKRGGGSPGTITSTSTSPSTTTNGATKITKDGHRVFYGTRAFF